MVIKKERKKHTLYTDAHMKNFFCTRGCFIINPRCSYCS